MTYSPDSDDFTTHRTPDNADVLAETETRFVREPWAERKVFVEALEKAMLDDEIGIRERAERVAIHRRFRALHDGLKRVNR